MEPGTDRTAPPPLTPSTLYLVATPIGNLEDLSARALRTLRECDVVAAEDTRRSGVLLQRLGIRRPLISYHRFNEARRGEEILGRLARGEKVAIVSDAGMPGISDPGQRVVASAVAAGFRVETVPGPCAFVSALTASGLPTDEVHFIGFLPHKSGQRRRELERLATIPGTVALYESPYRMERLLGEMAEVFPERTVVVARELTKKFEEFLRGQPAELQSLTRGRSWKGELTVLIAPEGVHLPTRVTAGIASENSMARSHGSASADGGAAVKPTTFVLALLQLRVDPGEPEVNLARAERAIREASQDGADVVLLPEVMDFGWTHGSAREGADRIPEGRTVEHFRRMASECGVHLCAGLAERDGERLYNAAVLIGPQGDLLLHHRKIHEIPFARRLYAVGDRLGVVDTPFGRLGLMICADALAPGNVVARALVAMGADGILSPCAWAVPAGHDNSLEPYGGLWMEHYAPVASEGNLWIAGCSNVGPVIEGEWGGWRCIGHSLVVGPEGKAVAWGPYGDEAEHRILVTLPTPYGSVARRGAPGQDFGGRSHVNGH